MGPYTPRTPSRRDGRLDPARHRRERFPGELIIEPRDPEHMARATRQHQCVKGIHQHQREEDQARNCGGDVQS